ncbi:MAG: hypothetical protein K2K73_02625 [Ureaplasma sp.]|nr:hypothetical protein [Ureaplasma sp.]
MKKTKLITSLVTGAGLIATAGISVIAITSCSLENDFEPDTLTKIIEVFPNKEVFDKMKAVLQKRIDILNQTQGNKLKINASIKVDKNIFYLEQSDGTVTIVEKYIFDNTDNVENILTINDYVDKKITITLQEAKERIYALFDESNI